MAAPMSVFLRTGMDADKMVAETARILSVPLVRIDEDGLTRYEHRGVGYTMTLLGDHGLENDMGIPFSSFDYEIDFVVSATGARPEDAANLKQWLAAYTFGKLTAALHCPGMVVYDLQEIIEQTG